MTERKYSVAELAALRMAIENNWSYGRYTPSQQLMGVSRPYFPDEKTKAVEELVRTHMLAGHTAEDLYASERNPA